LRALPCFHCAFYPPTSHSHRPLSVGKTDANSAHTGQHVLQLVCYCHLSGCFLCGIAAPFAKLLWTLALLDRNWHTNALVAFMLKRTTILCLPYSRTPGTGFTNYRAWRVYHPYWYWLSWYTWQVTSVITAVASFLLPLASGASYFDRVDAEVMKRSFTETV